MKNIDNCPQKDPPPLIRCNFLSVFDYGKLDGYSSMFYNDYQYLNISENNKFVA